MSFLVRALGVGLAAGAFACSSGSMVTTGSQANGVTRLDGSAAPDGADDADDADDAGDDGASLIGCTEDPRAETYAPNLAQPGQSGVFQFVLVSSDPAPPARATNTWTVKVLDGAGNPVTGGTFTNLLPFMPDHGHGSSIAPQASANADGTFTVAPLYLFMGGLWTVTLTFTAGSATDTVVFAFCVPG